MISISTATRCSSAPPRTARRARPRSPRCPGPCATPRRTDAIGEDTFTYTLLTDGANGSDTAAVHVTILPVNDPPVAVEDNATVAEGAGPTPIDVLANDTDIDGDVLAVTAADGAGHGVLNVADGVPHLRAGVRLRRDRRLHLHGRRWARRDEPRVGPGDRAAGCDAAGRHGAGRDAWERRHRLPRRCRSGWPGPAPMPSPAWRPTTSRSGSAAVGSHGASAGVRHCRGPDGQDRSDVRLPGAGHRPPRQHVGWSPVTTVLPGDTRRPRRRRTGPGDGPGHGPRRPPPGGRSGPRPPGDV